MLGGLKAQLMALGDETAQYMQDYIEERMVRPRSRDRNTDSLVASLTVDERYDTPEGFGWVVGDIEKLKEAAPHWAAINWGSDHLVGKTVRGEFPSGPPRKGASGEAWHSIEGSYAMNIQTPIQAMDYIEHGRLYLEQRLTQILASYLGT